MKKTLFTILCACIITVLFAGCATVRTTDASSTAAADAPVYYTGNDEPVTADVFIAR